MGIIALFHAFAPVETKPIDPKKVQEPQRLIPLWLQAVAFLIRSIPSVIFKRLDI